jgi:head-tail adaptor
MPGIRVHAGLLTKQVSFENPVKTQNASGGFAESFSEFCVTRGHFRQIDGNRNFDTGRDLMVSVYEMYCYWRSDLEANITKDTRVIYDNKNFRIERKERWNEDRMFYRMIISEAS